MRMFSALLLALILPATLTPAVLWIQPSRFSAAGGVTLTTNLISYWKLDEASGNRVDSVTATGNDLTDNNTVTNNTGIISNCANFDTANSEYLSHTSNTSLQAGNIDFTFSLWFRVESGTPSNTQLLAKDTDSPASSRDYTIDIQGSTLRFYINGGGTGLGVDSSQAISTGQWYFVVAWHDASADTVNIQVNNGTVDSASTSGTAPQTSSAQFRLGARQYSGFEGYMLGKIDEVGFWKRTLTSGERTSLYNSGAGLSYPF